jgi:glucokinase
MLTAGIDIGGTFTKLALVEPPERVVITGRVETRAADGAPALVARCTEAVADLCRQADRRLADLVGAGVGVAGLVDQRLGGPAAAPNLPAFVGVPVRSLFAAALERPVQVDNDANLWALGEAMLGAGRGYDVVCVLSLGTGIGGGLIDRGRVFRGARGMASEFGHMWVGGERRCACGQRGCLEAAASASAVVARARQALAAAVGSGGPLAEQLARGDDLTARDVGAAAQAGDRLALEVFEETGRWLGVGIANLVNALNPDAVIIGGGVAMVGEPLLGAARREVVSRVMPPLAEALSILPAALGDEGGVLGAALLALEPAAPPPDAAGSAGTGGSEDPAITGPSSDRPINPG